MIGLLGCATPVPPTSHGQVIYVDTDWLLVQHDDTRGRVVPGVEHYPRADLHAADLRPGNQVDLWLGAPPQRAMVTGGDPIDVSVHALTGVVVRVDSTVVTVDHGPIAGVMGAMVMNMQTARSTAESLSPGDHIEAGLVGSDFGWQLVNVTRTGTSDPTLRDEIRPLETGERLPQLTVPVTTGTLTLGGEGPPTALAFVYTTCPDPDYCPATVTRLHQLVRATTSPARVVTITIDPDHDTIAVLDAYAKQVGAPPERWSWGRLEPVALQQLAMHSGLAVSIESGRISHDLRLLVLDESGTLVARYDDNEWDVAEVANLLNPPAR